jgi:hypothetical protein
MSKKNSTKSSAGTTVNPAPQPAAQGGVSSSEFGVSSSLETRNPTPETSAHPRPAKGKTTAGPVKRSVTPKPATETSDDHEASAMAELTAALGIGDEAASAAASETPDDTNDSAAEPEFTGEESALDDASGETAQEESDPQASDSSDDTDPDSDPESNAEAAAEGADDDAGDDEGANGKWPKSFRRRINKLTEKIERLEAQAEEAQSLREENERLKTQTAEAPASSAPVTDAEHTLAAKLAKLETALDDIEAFPDHMTHGIELDGKQWTAKQVREEKREIARRMRDVEDELREHRRQRSARAEQVTSAIAERHPWMKDRKHQATAHVESLLRRYPVLKDIPEARLWIADGMAYQAQLMRASKTNGNGTNGHATNGAANGNGAPKPAPPPPRPVSRGPGKPAASPMAMNGARSNLRKTEERFFNDGDSEAGKDLVASLLGD